MSVSPRQLEANTHLKEAQWALDELWKENLIPFELTAWEVDFVGLEEYIVRFNDARLFAVDVSRQEGESFKNVFRLAILNRVSRLSGPSTNRGRRI